MPPSCAYFRLSHSKYKYGLGHLPSPNVDLLSCSLLVMRNVTWRVKGLLFPGFSDSRPPLPLVRQMLSHLPNDVLHEILEYLDTSSLCHLSNTCYRFHYISLCTVFRRAGIPDVRTEIHLNHSNIHILPALRFSLFLDSTEKFTWHATSRDTWVSEVKQIERIMSRMYRIGHTELDFSRGTNFGWTAKDVKAVNQKCVRPWIKLCTGFLHLVAQKSLCLEITNNMVSEILQSPSSPLCLDRRFVDRKMEGRSVQMSGKSATQGLETPLLDESLSPRHFPSLGFKRKPGYAVSSLALSDPSLFRNPAFLYWSIKWINSMPLKHLVLMQGDIRLPLLRHLRLSSTLVDLTLSHAKTTTDEDMAKFLARHPALTTIDLYGSVFDEHSSTHFDILPEWGLTVTTLAGSDTLLNHILNLKFALPNLSSLIIQLDSDSTVGDAAKNSALYEAITLRENITNICFQAPVGAFTGLVAEWQHALDKSTNDSIRDGQRECSHALKYLKFEGYPSKKPQNPGMPYRFPRWNWAELFLSLEVLNLCSIFGGSADDSQLCERVVGKIHQECAHLSILVDDVAVRMAPSSR
jgi:hypothetical protein